MNVTDTEVLAAVFLAGAVSALTVVRWVVKLRRNGWSWPPSKKGRDE